MPYVNRWGSEKGELLTIRHDPHVGGPAIFCDDEHETEPDFKAQNMQRQRECVAAGLCQVCARPIPWSRRFLVISGMSVEWVHVQTLGRTVPVVTEPWLDERCARFAMERCPGLIRRARKAELTLVPIRRQKDTQLVVSRGWVEGELEEASRELEPAMWCKIALPKLTIRKGPRGTGAGTGAGTERDTADPAR